MSSNSLSLTSWIGDLGVTALHLAVGYGTETFASCVTHRLLKQGSDPNAHSSCGKTPVHVAAAWGRVQILHLLLLHGGDPWRQDDEQKNAFNYAFELKAWDAIKVLHDFQLTSPKQCCRLNISPVQRNEYTEKSLSDSEDEKNVRKSYITTNNFIISHIHEIHLEGEINNTSEDEIFCNEEVSLSFDSQENIFDIKPKNSDMNNETVERNRTFTVETKIPAQAEKQNLFTELISAVKKRALRISGINTLNSENETPIKKEEIKPEPIEAVDVSDDSAAFLSLSPEVSANFESCEAVDLSTNYSR